ncbi:hypothetical protein [Streptomyces sp. SID3343]|nr:hypothetical protein [Streptomyces sp. SID3343]
MKREQCSRLESLAEWMPLPLLWQWRLAMRLMIRTESTALGVL